jgi:thioredoxin-related protein
MNAALFRFRTGYFLLAILLGPCAGRSQDAEALLPEWEEAGSVMPEDTLAPASGLLPDPGPEGEPVDLPPANMLPELPPLQTPSDGEAAPELPEVPGLIAPKVGPVPLNKAGLPLVPDPLANISGGIFWHRSPREARAKAQQLGKPMLLVLAGFSWSPACKALDADLFAHEEFKKYAAENLVLSFLNVPTKTSVNSNGETDNLKDRQLLAIQAYRKFLKVRSLPTVIIFDAEGHEVDRMVGYNFNKGMRVNAFLRAAERIKVTVKHCNDLRDKQQRRRQLLTETQRYRDWESRVGTKLFAKVVSLTQVAKPSEDDEIEWEPAAILMDENGLKRTIPLRSLTLTEAEIARRMVESYRSGSLVQGSIEGLPIRTPDTLESSVDIAPSTAEKSNE